ncbi:hypothetical protein CERSUDRAFT_147423 [Gelatoporia subvermispora B]|uniref:Rrp15p-domain-containing protein n=1 Tax=Ceriporiopsis subvermispora (strain B) TaxID=914234 RepID=M2RU58_CERS8|nr:hypothetical protein CERSUDRAFT_147423 [Gelatoporia subvermispora B]
MPPAKKQKPTKTAGSDLGEEESMHEFEEGSSGIASGSEQSFLHEDSAPDTEDEIADAKHVKSKKTLKRKHRATDATRFGAALQSLLDTETPSAVPLALKPSIGKKRTDEKLEKKGKKVLQIQKKEKEEKGRIRDVIGGWGGEGERALRKVAQRGVVKLFNVIQQSQATASVEAEQVKSLRGSGKPTLPAPAIGKPKGKKGRHNETNVGKPSGASLGQSDFLDMIKSGGLVSKA